MNSNEPNFLTKLKWNLPSLMRYPFVRGKSLSEKGASGQKHIIFTMYNQPTDLARLNRWLLANVTVKNRPEWIFVKLYCHGFFDHDQRASIGEDAVRFFNNVIENGEKIGDYKVYFASAREAFNMVLAAIDGKTGNPGDFKNYRLKAIMDEKMRREKTEIRRQIELC